MAGTIVIAIRKDAARGLLKKKSGEDQSSHDDDTEQEERPKGAPDPGEPSEATIQFDKAVVPMDMKQIPEGAPIKMMIEGTFNGFERKKISLSVTAFQIQMSTGQESEEENTSHKNGSSHNDKKKTNPGKTISYTT